MAASVNNLTCSRRVMATGLSVQKYEFVSMLSKLLAQRSGAYQPVWLLVGFSSMEDSYPSTLMSDPECSIPFHDQAHSLDYAEEVFRMALKQQQCRVR